MNVKDFIDYIKQAKSKATLKNYKQGLKKFTAWYQKRRQHDFDREI